MGNFKKYSLDLISLILILLTPYLVFASNDIQNMKTLPLMMFTGPVLSPDSEKISFDFIWGKYNKASADFAVLTLKNDEIQTITKSNKDGSINEYPSFLKDNMNILFRSVKKNGVGLFLVNLKTLEENILVFDYDKSYINKEYIDVAYVSPICLPLKDKVIFIKQRVYSDDVNYLGYIYDLKEKKKENLREI